ncbi:MAG TPA: DUF4389 domain-containing protein [Acidimicrobiia bacterium]|jgi:hypothetical protein|nr:DUF4389 domain-containing protein [Acidimicrobiia bacterium]
MQAPSSAYPATFAIDAPEQVANWRAIGHVFMAIPHLIVLYVLQFVSEVVGFVSWLLILFTGKLPEGLAGVQAMYIRYTVRTYTYVLFMREEYPPFSFETSAADPGDDPRVRVDFLPQLTDRNRLTVFFRIILVIPHLIVLAILAIGGWIAAVIAFFAVLFTGRWPEGLRDFIVKLMRWSVRVQSYFLLLNDVYPPFELD